MQSAIADSKHAFHIPCLVFFFLLFFQNGKRLDLLRADSSSSTANNCRINYISVVGYTSCRANRDSSCQELGIMNNRVSGAVVTYG